MATEIELKLSIQENQIGLLRAHPLLQNLPEDKFDLHNIYYDTPNQELRKKGVALRMRRKGQMVWLMTVKTTASGSGGLAQRGEWEAPAQPGVFDFSIVDDQSLRLFLESLRPKLQAIFTTDFVRSTWEIVQNEAMIELALDVGKVSLVSQENITSSESLCEIELELLEGGSAETLFRLALELGQNLSLHPQIISKAERGYRQLDPSAFLPVKNFYSPITAVCSPIEAFRLVALTCLSNLQRNELGVICGEHPDFIHQSRVAIRRLRAAFKLFRPILSENFIAVYVPRWKKLANQLGGARDLDVFLAETMIPLEEAFPSDPDLCMLRKNAEEDKAKVKSTASNVMCQTEYSQLILAFSAALFWESPDAIGINNDAAKMSLEKFADWRLNRLANKVKKQVRRHKRMKVEELHRLRIIFKELRYALEFFSPLLPARRKVAYLTRLATIQDMLGMLNDQAVASELIEKIHPDSRKVLLTQGWIAGRVELLRRVLDIELLKFSKLKRPWQK